LRLSSKKTRFVIKFFCLKINNLRIVKFVDFGAYLDGGDAGEILIPGKYLDTNWKVDDTIEIFLYRDSEDRLIATTEKPYAKIGDFAFLKVVATSKAGAFVDWGLQKDLLVPFSEQTRKMEIDKSYLIHIYLDEKTDRVVGSSKFEKFLNKKEIKFEIGQEVDLWFYGKTDLGYKVIVNNSHSGVVYANEVFQEVKYGFRTNGFIKKIREDGKLDISLYRQGC